MSERVKLADIGILSGIADTDYVTLEHNGAMGRYSFADFKNAVISESERAMAMDNVFVYCLPSGTTGGRFVPPRDWAEVSVASGLTAEGVAIVTPSKILIVSLTASPTVPWSSSQRNVGTLYGTDVAAATLDLTGKESTQAIIAVSSDTFITNTADYAAGYCNLYASANIAAGSWWLPSLGEMLMIMAHLDKVNYALSVVNGAEAIAGSAHWVTTERDYSNAYTVNMGTGLLHNRSKDTVSFAVRPVTEVQSAIS